MTLVRQATWTRTRVKSAAPPPETTTRFQQEHRQTRRMQPQWHAQWAKQRENLTHKKWSRLQPDSVNRQSRRRWPSTSSSGSTVLSSRSRQHRITRIQWRTDREGNKPHSLCKRAAMRRVVPNAAKGRVQAESACANKQRIDSQRPEKKVSESVREYI